MAKQEMVEDYLKLCNGDYSFIKMGNQYKVTDNHNGQDFSLEIVNGRIRCNGQDCIETMESAYDNDKEILNSISDFKKKWY